MNNHRQGHGRYIDIAIPAQAPTNVYYATGSGIYKSTDAGNTFFRIYPDPGGGNVLITSIDIVQMDKTNIIAVRTIDTDTAQYGGVYLLDERKIGSNWVNTAIGNYDVYRVAFSPDYSNDHQLIAVVTDEVDTFTISKIDTMNWGKWISNARIPTIVPSAVEITFPDNYDGSANNAAFFAGIATGTGSGDVYQIYSARAPAVSTAQDFKYRRS